MPTFKLDGKEITAEPGTSILQAAIDSGIEIPHYCYHEALTVVGSCRLCLVELNNSPKLVPSCAQNVQDGIEVRTNSDTVKQARESMLEFFLINHPLDCPICDKAGECELQDYTFKYGSSHSRMVEEKRVRPTKDLGGNILLYRNRCVMCTRCVRFYEDIVGESYLTVENRGYRSDISIFPGKGLTHKMTGNIVEICPVGCLIDKDFLFNARVWNLETTKSVCPGCSAGCSINLQHKDNKIYRIRSRQNTQVNQQWICDDGRYLYHRYEKLERIGFPKKRGGEKLNNTSWAEALSIISDRLALVKRSKESEKVAVVGSAFATNEENYLLYKIFHDEIGCDKFFVYNREAEGEDEVIKSGFTVYSDKSPNYYGAKLILGERTDFWSEIKNGNIEVLYFLNGDIDFKVTDQQKELLKKLDFLFVQCVAMNDLVRLANVALPTAYFAEQSGSYVNAKGHVQKFQSALKPPSETKEGWQILADLYMTFNGGVSFVSVGDVVNDMAQNISAFKDISFFKLGDEGSRIR
jgi:NADH-quinone oxidoreductase subunit G